MTEADLARRRAVTSVLGGGSSPMRLWTDESWSPSAEPVLTQAIANRIAQQFEAVEAHSNEFAAFVAGMDTQRATLTSLMLVATGPPGFTESNTIPPGTNTDHAPELYVYSTETPTGDADTWQTPVTGGSYLMRVWDPTWRNYVISALSSRVSSSGADAVAAVGFGREGATSVVPTSSL
jgi:hypothetical protein